MKGFTHAVYLDGLAKHLRGYWNVNTGELVFEDGTLWCKGVPAVMLKLYTLKKLTPINLENK